MPAEPAPVRSAILYADGAARGNPGPAGAGAVLLDEGGKVLAELHRALGRATNNVAEYEALILGLDEARRRGLDRIEVRMDSLLVVRQMQGLWKIKHPGLRPLALRAGALLAEFGSRRIEHVPREENSHADRLANVAIDEAAAAAPAPAAKGSGEAGAEKKENGGEADRREERA